MLMRIFLASKSPNFNRKAIGSVGGRNQGPAYFFGCKLHVCPRSRGSRGSRRARLSLKVPAMMLTHNPVRRRAVAKLVGSCPKLPLFPNFFLGRSPYFALRITKTMSTLQTFRHATNDSVQEDRSSAAARFHSKPGGSSRVHRVLHCPCRRRSLTLTVSVRDDALRLRCRARWLD